MTVPTPTAKQPAEPLPSSSHMLVAPRAPPACLLLNSPKCPRALPPPAAVIVSARELRAERRPIVLRAARHAARKL
eukprot:365806-Chlamydomonas_euryale.AAC.2